MCASDWNKQLWGADLADRCLICWRDRTSFLVPFFDMLLVRLTKTPPRRSKFNRLPFLNRAAQVNSFLLKSRGALWASWHLSLVVHVVFWVYSNVCQCSSTKPNRSRSDPKVCLAFSDALYGQKRCQQRIVTCLPLNVHVMLFARKYVYARIFGLYL